MPDPRPIGFFDSGVGGLTVLREVIRRSPAESTLYLGDNERAPYGPRPDAEVIAFSLQCLDVLASRDVKAIVVACNTSSAVALPTMRARYDVPIVGVVRPGATAAALATRTRRVGVIATQATVRSHAYFQAIKDENPFIEVYEHATPAFVPLVEAGLLAGDEVRATVAAGLAPLLGSDGDDGTGPATGAGTVARASDDDAVFPRPSDQPIDTLLLGCTHYPLLAPVIRELAGPEVAVIDSATATASALAGLLEINDLAAPPDRAADHVQLTTGDVAGFRRTADRLFGDLVPSVEPIVLAGVA